MKYKYLAQCLVLSLILFTSIVTSAELKVGFISVEKILREAPQTIEIEKKLTKEFSVRTDKLKGDVKVLKEKEVAFSKEVLTMKDSERDMKEKSLAQVRIEIQRADRELKEDAGIRRNEELATLQDTINKVVTSVAKAEGYDLVVYTGVAYNSEKIDITDKILKSLGKK